MTIKNDNQNIYFMNINIAVFFLLTSFMSVLADDIRQKVVIANGRPIQLQENAYSIWRTIEGKYDLNNVRIKIYAKSLRGEFYALIKNDKTIVMFDIRNGNTLHEKTKAIEKETFDWVVSFFEKVSRLSKSGMVECDYSKDVNNDGLVCFGFDGYSYGVDTFFDGTWNASFVVLVNHMIRGVYGSDETFTIDQKKRKDILGEKDVFGNLQSEKILKKNQDYYIYIVGEKNNEGRGIIDVDSR